MKRQPLFIEVARDLEDLIAREYPPGSKIPTEAELSAMYNISNTTLRPAIQILCARNILEIRRGQGTFVTKKPGLAPDALGLHFLNSDDYKRDLYEISDIFQPALAALAAQRITETDVEFLSDCIRALNDGWSDYQRGKVDFKTLQELDSNFHSSVIKTSHNIIADRIDSILKECSHAIRPHNVGFIQDSMEMHPKILEALKNRDSDQASALMRKHLMQVNRFFYEESETEKAGA